MLREYIINYLETDKSRSSKSNLIKLLISDENKSQEINSFIDFGTFKQKLFHYINDNKDKPNCLICKQDVNWNEKDFCYRETCSSKCSGKLNLFRSSKKEILHPMLETKEQFYNYFVSGRIKVIESSISKYYPEIIEFIKDINFTTDFTQKVYCYLKDIMKHPVCKNCSSKVKFDTFSKGYHEFCSVRCSSNSFEKKDLIRKTVNIKYGVNNISQVTRKKAFNTMVDKYGSHFSSTKDFINKLKKTTLKLHGKEYYFQTDEFKEKYKEYCLVNFGVSHFMKTKEGIDRVLETKKQRGIIYKWSEEELKSYEKYRQKVTYLSEKNYLDYKNLINPNNYERGHLTYHLDHIYPVILGFINNIDAELIAHYKNLQLLTHSQNRSKGDRTNMSIDDFYFLIKI